MSQTRETTTPASPAPLDSIPMPKAINLSSSTASMNSLMSADSMSLDSLSSAESMDVKSDNAQKSPAPSSPHSSIGVQTTLEDFRTEMIWKLARYQFDPLFQVKYKASNWYKQNHEILKEIASLRYQSEANYEKAFWEKLFLKVTQILWEQSYAKGKALILSPLDPVLEYTHSLFKPGGLIRDCDDPDLKFIASKAGVTSLLLYAKSRLAELLKELGVDKDILVTKLHNSAPVLTRPDKKKEIPATPKTAGQQPRVMQRSYLSHISGMFNSLWNYKSNFTPSAITINHDENIKPKV